MFVDAADLKKSCQFRSNYNKSPMAFANKTAKTIGLFKRKILIVYVRGVKPF